METKTMHDERAMAAAVDAATDETPLAATCARQGDLVLERTGDAESGKATPEWGIEVAHGQHGQHRIIATAYHRDGDVVHLAGGGLVVHTDVPSARHGAIRLTPGAWQIRRLRELDTDSTVQQVID